jgi:hypothetical protein
MRIRVQFKFPDREEVRFVDRVPSRGNFIRSHGATWLVTDVADEGGGSYSVTLLGTPKNGPKRST